MWIAAGRDAASPSRRSVMPRLLAVPALAVLAVAEPARAHGALAAGDFYTGLLQPVFHPASLLLVAALALFATRLPEPALWRFPLAFAGASAAGAGLAWAGLPLPGSAWAVRAGTLALALAVAVRRAPGPALAIAVAAALGLAHGHLATFAERAELGGPVGFACGLALGPLLVWAHGVAVVTRFRAFWLEVAWRVVGSWIAAVSLLVSALELVGPATRAAGG